MRGRHSFSDDVQGADFAGVKVQPSAGVPAFVLHDIRDFSVFRSKPVPDTELQTADKRRTLAEAGPRR